MGNNNATASLTAEEEGSKPPLEADPVKTTQDHVFLAGEGKDGDIEKERSPDETEPQSMEFVEDVKVKKVEEEMHQSALESLVMETVEQLQKQKSVTEGVEIVREAKEVEELSTVGTESVERKLITTEFGSEEKPCVIDETVYETDGTKEEKMINEFLEEIVPAEDVVKVDQENGLEQRTKFPEMEPEDHRDDEVANEVKADQAISKPSSHRTSAVQKTCQDMESGREANLKRMIRCKSLPVSHSIRVIGYSLAQQVVTKVGFPSGFTIPNTSETLLGSCVESEKAQEPTEAITESNKEARSSSFGYDLTMDEPTMKTAVLCQDKTETYEATIAVEEKTVMLKKSESDKKRGIELSLGLSMKPIERSEADDSFKETKGAEDNFLDKKASLGSMKVRVRKRSKSSLFGTCLCCNAALN